ncbi:MAG TPA: NAD(P)H-dependent oxidoreductase [Candidatus Avacidaminococcus intestinavium]|uniref:NAD(P)H-dependent oxidoreductase n=1 Tax=Candidatus Avacidaminococcus intestinavium TaxID=2840684 RepID=A0A9D1SK59_9FIRM|nr:NAD(P)H-dependent oxidoreductase [Candidatus Avacidaminococcus intestinavium]
MDNKRNILLDTLSFRYACKKFDPNKLISDEDFKSILTAGQLAPTSFGFEPWHALVIQDPKLREKLYPFVWGGQAGLSGASHFVILLARKKTDLLATSDYITHMMEEIQKLPPDITKYKRNIFKKFQEEDFNIMETDRAAFDWSCKQTYIVLANMLTAAAFLGIDSCPIEGFSTVAVNKTLIDEGLLDPTHFSVAVMAAFGYRDEIPKHTKTRQALTDLVTFK